MKYGSTVEWYNFWYIVLRRRQKVIPQVASIDETIRQIASERCSVSRFGDGRDITDPGVEKHWFPERRPRTCREAQGSAKKPRTRAFGLCVGRISTFRRYNGKHAASGGHIFSFTARGGTVYWFQDEKYYNSVCHLVPTLDFARNKIADDGSEP